MKKLLLTMAAAAVVLSANAQRLVSQRFLGQLENAITGTTTIPRSNKLPKKANLAANQRLVGYYATDDVDNSLGVGNYTTEDIEPAIFLQQGDSSALCHGRQFHGQGRDDLHRRR